MAKFSSSPESAKSQPHCPSVPITATPPEPTSDIGEPSDTGTPFTKAISIPPLYSSKLGSGKITDILLSVTGGSKLQSSTV